MCYTNQFICGCDNSVREQIPCPAGLFMDKLGNGLVPKCGDDLVPKCRRTGELLTVKFGTGVCKPCQQRRAQDDRTQKNLANFERQCDELIAVEEAAETKLLEEEEQRLSLFQRLVKEAKERLGGKVNN